MNRADLPALSLFLTVVEQGGFRPAARALMMSPSAVSNEVRRLERHLNQQLLVRTTRSIALTPAGARLLETLKPALASISQGLSELERLREVPAGTVRVSMPQSLALHLFLPRLAEFHRRYPEIDVEIDGHNKFIDVVAEGFDAGVRLGESLANDMIAVPVSAPERLAIVASAAAIAMWGVPADPSDLHAVPCIRQRMPSGRIYDWELQRDGRAIEVAVNGAVTVSDDRLALEAARQGLGFACVIASWAEPLIALGEIKTVLDAWCMPFPGFFLYYPDKRLRPAVRAFVDFFRV